MKVYDIGTEQTVYYTSLIIIMNIAEPKDVDL